MYLRVENQIWNLFRAVMYTLIKVWCFWYITKIDMVYFHYKNIQTARSSFSFHTTWSHSNKAVQQAVPFIATHINELKLKIKIQCRKGFNNVNISNGLFFSERCVQTNFHNVLTGVIQFVCTQCRSYKNTTVHCLNVATTQPKSESSVTFRKDTWYDKEGWISFQWTSINM